MRITSKGWKIDLPHREFGVYAFGPFRPDPVRRRLTRDDTPVALGDRLLETLLYLVQNHGRLVERHESENYRAKTLAGGSI
jgi:DNA-binding response OmpR family regulator